MAMHKTKIHDIVPLDFCSQQPNNDIDVYLQFLIEDLQTL